MEGRGCVRVQLAATQGIAWIGRSSASHGEQAAPNGARSPVKDHLACGLLDAEPKEMYKAAGCRSGQPLIRAKPEISSIKHLHRTRR